MEIVEIETSNGKGIPGVLLTEMLTQDCMTEWIWREEKKTENKFLVEEC